MDFMKWLSSLDELLYEVMSWLLFFPLTLWRAATSPLRTMAEVAGQSMLPEEEQYAALLSPPLFLTLALLIAHGAATALGQTDAIIADRHGLAGLIDDTASALALRVIVFAAFPLFLAARFVRRQGLGLDRGTLRRPFYEQCYPAGVFALGATLGTSLILVADAAVRTAGQALLAATILYYVAVCVRWFARGIGTGTARALLSVSVALVQGAVFFLLVGFLFTR